MGLSHRAALERRRHTGDAGLHSPRSRRTSLEAEKVKVFVDSSVLVAAFLADHENHEASLAAFAGASVKNG